jgi:hypothetical protein
MRVVLFRVREYIKQHDQKHKSVASQHTKMPDLMVAKIWRKWIWLSIRKDQRADGVAESACDKQ